MKALASFMIVLSSVLLASGALAADEADRPAGVAEHNWILISDRLGFVVVKPKDSPILGTTSVRLAPPESVSAEHMPPKKDYFVIRTSTGWQRLVISDPSETRGLVPAGPFRGSVATDLVRSTRRFATRLRAPTAMERSSSA